MLGEYGVAIGAGPAGGGTRGGSGGAMDLLASTDPATLVGIGLIGAGIVLVLMLTR